MAQARAPMGMEKRAHIYTRLRQAGAHFVVDGVGDLPVVVEEIQSRLTRGEGP